MARRLRWSLGRPVRECCCGTKSRESFAVTGGHVASFSCPENDRRVRKTTAVGAGVVAECRSALDGSHWSFRVTFKQGLGHFTLEEKLS